MCPCTPSPSRAYSAEGRRPSTGPEKRSAPRAGQRLGGASRQPRAAASAESEGPSSPITRRERVCVSWWGGLLHDLSNPVLCHDTPPPGRSLKKSADCSAITLRSESPEEICPAILRANASEDSNPMFSTHASLPIGGGSHVRQSAAAVGDRAVSQSVCH